MAYQTYTTMALVCGTKDRNTNDRSYMLFTREAGMLFADARSSRKELSRQRGALQDFSLVKVSLVKGKYGWKIGSIESYKNYYLQAADKSARGSIVSICRLLRRFVKGEEADVELFDYVLSVLEELGIEINKRFFVQMVAQVRILGFLGYVDVKRLPASLRGAKPINIEKLSTKNMVEEVESIYNHAIAMSHL